MGTRTQVTEQAGTRQVIKEVSFDDLFYKLLKAEDEVQVEHILDAAGYSLDQEDAWRPLGDFENNFATVANQQTEATAAMVEKIINAIDGVLMSECHRRGIDPEGAKAPRTMQEAVEMFFGVREGRLDNLSAEEQTALADAIQVVAVGEKSSPCYLIIDQGEGQSPASFPDTFLSLKRSNKIRIPFVQGKYNSGGTGVLQFCGEDGKNMQLIVSRRQPHAPVVSGDTTKDDWGFTIVRRMKPVGGRRSSMYVYLAPGGQVPSFSADSIRILPEKRKSLTPRPYATELQHGTCIKLYNFRWRARSLATTEARYELERYLHSPSLPFRVTETRDYTANYYSTTITGVWASVASAVDDAKNKRVEPGFPAYGDFALPNVGNLPYRIVVFRDREDGDERGAGRRHPHGVFFTVNGQVHGSLPSDFVGRCLKFDQLKDDLLVSIDCTAMEEGVREDFFMASRDRVRKNEVYDEIEEKVTRELRDHQGLRDLQAARRQRQIEKAISDPTETANFFNELLKADPTLSALFSAGNRLVTRSGPGEPIPFHGQQFPSFFRLEKNPKGGLVKPCALNQTCKVEFETDAANNYFKRPDSAGRITTAPANLIEHSHLWNGRFVARLRTPWDAKAGDRIQVTVTVEDVQTQMRARPFVSGFTLLAESEAEPRMGGKSSRRPSGEGDGRQSTPNLAVPEVHDVRKEGWQSMKPPFNEFTAIQVNHDDKGGYDFFLNVDNTFLLTEMQRAKDEDRLLVKFWFKYGLALCALGMLQEQKRRIKNAGSNGDGDEDDGKRNGGENLEAIGAYCSGAARVIVPIIRALYRGPQVSGS
jgi:hypothetical protein